MAVGSNINLELYWQGPYIYSKDWDISILDINMAETNYEISAHINKDLSSTHEQRLNFRVSEKGGSIFESEEESESIECPIDFAKSMKVSARIFQSYENRSVQIRQLDGSYSYEKRVLRDDLPVFIDKFPEFQPSEIYQIKITSQKDSLQATIEKKVSEVLTQKMSEEKKTSPTSEKKTEEIDPDQLSTAFDGFGKMLKAASIPNPSLEDVSIPDLQERLEIANRKLIIARSSFEKACQSGDKSLLMSELAGKQKIMQEVLGLQRELKLRSIPQKDLSSQECVIS